MGMISRKTVSKRTAAHLRMMLLAFICLLVWVPFLLMAAACFMPEDELLLAANQWELHHGGLTGRTAQQFIDYLLGQRK